MRWIAAVGARLALMLCVWLALEGWSLSMQVPASLHIIYAVDRSASIDEAQRAWMARRISSLDTRQPKAATRAIVAFGAQAQVVEPARGLPFDDPAALEQALAAAAVDPTSTNLDAALLTGLGTVPAGSRARIVLLTDGRATSAARHSLTGEDKAGSVGRGSGGQLESVVRYLNRFQVAVYPSAPPATQEGGWSWDRLSVPPVVRQGASVPVRK